MASTGRYAALLHITSSQENAALFARLLPAERFAPEYSVCSPLEARFVLMSSAYDVAVIDESVPETEAFAIADTAVENGVSSVLLVAEADRFEAAAEFAQSRGFMALPSPVEPAMLRQSLGMMAAVSARIHDLEDTAEDLREKMEEVRLVSRAKLILVQRFKMSEKEAHRFIEKNAMDRCVTRRDIADGIIRTYQN